MSNPENPNTQADLTGREASSIRILFFLLAGMDKASSRVRGFWIADELRHRGIQVTTLYGDHLISYFRCIWKLFFHDTLIVQKRNTRWDYWVVRIARFLNRKVIYDYDDYYSPVSSQVTLHNVARIMTASDLVTVGCRALVDFSVKYQPQSHFVPTTVRLENYKVHPSKSGNDHVCLGWIGNGRTYAPDLCEILKLALDEAGKRMSLRVKIVGACADHRLHNEFSGIEGVEVELIDQIDWSDSSEVMNSIADFDIGLFPLHDNLVNQHKCGFKALEYMAIGIPVIGSPIGANAYVIDHGKTGFLANTTADWVYAIEKLAADPILRRNMGRVGRKKVELEYSTERHVDELETLVQSLQQGQRNA